RISYASIVALGLSTASGAAADDEAATSVEAPRSAPPAYVAEPAPKGPPLGNRGFQIAFRTGAMAPMGSVKDPSAEDTMSGAGSSMSDLVGWQFPIVADIGGKPIPHLFIGGYVGFGVGQTAGELDRACQSRHLDCRAGSLQLGAEIIYAILPPQWVNPWG